MSDELDGITDRIRRHIHIDGGCWIWTGALDGSGYAAIDVNGRTERVHRILWQVQHHQTRRHLFNRCGTRHCIRPDHWTPANPRGSLTRSEAFARI